jgi:hypothetical protein
MDRRSFLTNSIGALLGIALTSNKVLSSVVETLTPQSPKVLLFLIQNKKGQWKVRGTKWIDVPTKKLDSNKVLLDTFKPLEIVDNEIANDRKNILWVEHKCSGQKGGPLNVEVAKQRAKKAHVSPKMKQYLESEEWKKNWEKGRLAGSGKWGKELGQKNKESGWLDKIRPNDFYKNFTNRTSEQKKEDRILGGKAASIVNLKSGQVMMAQKLAGKSRRKKVIDISTGIIYDSVKIVSNTFDLHYGSLKNQLTNNGGRKNKTPFKYI